MESFAARLTFNFDSNEWESFDSFFGFIEELAEEHGVSTKYVSTETGKVTVVGESQEILDLAYDLYEHLGYPWKEREVVAMLEPLYDKL